MKGKLKYHIAPHEIRTYSKENSCVFKKNNDKYGDLSNMATGFPIFINGTKIRTAEALYQACRFPHLPDLQSRIVNQSSPMQVKMISNSNKLNSREDWDNVRIKVMKWCLQIKLAQNFIMFGAALNETGLKDIVENSSSDNFWGAIPSDDRKTFTGKNALGRLLMDLRQNFYGKNKYSLLLVKPPEIENFALFSQRIEIIDERQNFINTLITYWNDGDNNGMQGQLFEDL